jgi:hypothetical protein
MIEGDGIGISRCDGCGALSLAIFQSGHPVAFVCPPEDSLLKLITAILDELGESLGRPKQ